MNLSNLVDSLPKKTRYIVDIGASYGVHTNPVFSFEKNPEFRGLCIEGDRDKTNVLVHNISSRFKIVNSYITPDNALQLFADAGVPLAFDVLKVDIDGYDLELLRTLLKVYKPSVIIAEINEKIPPPIKFEVLYRNTYAWDTSHHFGFSIASGVDVMNENGYIVKCLYETNNILCLHHSVTDETQPDIAEIYKTQYIDYVGRPTEFPWNADVDYWLRIQNPDVLKDEITNYFETNNSRSNFNIKTKKKGVDFTIA